MVPLMLKPPPGLNDPHERLTWARQRKFKSRAEAARALGMKEGTYRAYERAPDASKSIPLDYEAALAFGRKFGVSWVWLLNGSSQDYQAEAETQTLQELQGLVARMDEEQRRQLLAIARTFNVRDWTEEELRYIEQSDRTGDALIARTLRRTPE